MIFTQTPLAGAYLIDLEKRGDDRGFFARSFCEREFAAHRSRHPLRTGQQLPERPQGNPSGHALPARPQGGNQARPVYPGRTYDLILDLRHDSPTFGQSFGAELSAENRRMMYVPKGFAHGFITLAEDTEAFYFVDEFYAPDLERGVRWNDPKFSLSWPLPPAVLSDKDAAHRDFDPSWHLSA